MALTKIAPALTHTIKEFIAAGQSDDMTYRNFSILEKIDGVEFVDHNLIYDYLDELVKLSKEVYLTDADVIRYQYAPDLLAYHLYGSTQLDFVIMAANDIMDPKEFTLKSKKIKVIVPTMIKDFLSKIYNAEKAYININRSDYKKS